MDNPLLVMDYVSFIPKFAVQKNYAQDRPHSPEFRNWFPFDIKPHMYIITQDDTELAFSLGIVTTFWTMFWAYTITLSLRTDISWMAPAGITEDEYQPPQDPLPIYMEVLLVPEPITSNNYQSSEPFH
jgi:hypothetical protein